MKIDFVKYCSLQLYRLVIAIAVLFLLDLSPVAAESPTLARLVFWAPPERMSEFAVAYEQQVVPLLQKHHLISSPQQSRTTVDSVFSRLFAWTTVDLFEESWTALQQDTTWNEQMLQLGAVFGSDDKAPLRHTFELYTWPVTVDSTVVAGQGFRQGMWQTYGREDGVGDNRVAAIAADELNQIWVGTTTLERYDGQTFTRFAIGASSNRVCAIQADGRDLWIGTTSNGLIHYDGQTFTRFTTADGLARETVGNLSLDRQGNLWIGTGNDLGAFSKGGGGLTRWDGHTFNTFTVADGLADNTVYALLEDHRGMLWTATDNGLSRFDGTTWQTFTTANGLSNNKVVALTEDDEGHLWLATMGGGAIRYDGRAFTALTTEDGLGDNQVYSTTKDLEGNLWFGTSKGISRWDGQTVTHFDTEDGLGSNLALSLTVDSDGHLWTGNMGSGISRWSGRQFTNFTAVDGLLDITVQSIAEDSKGNLWFGAIGVVSRYDGEHFTHFAIGVEGASVKKIIEDNEGQLWFTSQGEGVFRYDGQAFTRFTDEDGLGNNYVFSMTKDLEDNLWFLTMGNGATRYNGQSFEIFQVGEWFFNVYADRRGRVWLASGRGPVLRYDGEQFSAYPLPKTSAVDFFPITVFEDRQGGFWFGQWQDGVLYYDGQTSKKFAPADGLGHGFMISALEDDRGHIWIVTYGGGISRYDGLVFQSLTRRDGLLSDSVQQVYQDSRGQIWIATESGIVRYRPSTLPPGIDLTNVITDIIQGPLSEVEMSSVQPSVTFEFQGNSFTTHSDRFAYVYRLLGYDETWQTTQDKRITYTDLPVGQYTFEVKAVDIDLNYSPKPARVQLKVHLPYYQITLWSGLGLSLFGLIVAAGYGIRRKQERNRAREELVQELERELQIAHDMQMGLMPKESPTIQGVDVAGRCLPAHHVGGDFFQYFPLSDNRLAVSLADVTGHAMEAAVPVMMFSGILDTQIEAGNSLEGLFAKLNHSLHRNLDKRTFICFAMGELDTDNKKFRLANGGCPYPYHYKAASGEIVELQIDGYPLGVRSDTKYPVIEIQLRAGDRIVFCSDGIIEASTSAYEMFGFERTAATIQQGCQQQLSAPQLLDYLVSEVQSFTGDAVQGDDQTVVVLAVEE